MNCVKPALCLMTKTIRAESSWRCAQDPAPSLGLPPLQPLLRLRGVPQPAGGAAGGCGGDEPIAVGIRGERRALARAGGEQLRRALRPTPEHGHVTRMMRLELR